MSEIRPDSPDHLRIQLPAGADPNLPILGQPIQYAYDLQIPENCTARQLGIFLTGFLTSMGVGFAFTDAEYQKIHPKNPRLVRAPDR